MSDDCNRSISIDSGLVVDHNTSISGSSHQSVEQPKTQQEDVSFSSLLFSSNSSRSSCHDDESMNEEALDIQSPPKLFLNWQDDKADKAGVEVKDDETPRVSFVDRESTKIPRVREAGREIGGKHKSGAVLRRLFRRLSFRKNLKNFSPFTS